ncbi:hypothetical protein VTJ83DRAFT_1000 [Remersonia thermophila]|uniref:Uncharacterized protein n=1 Tax=Remersonia thermophila TaxID=72144 RepID=A0ABR4DMT4_9PEZI
MERKRIVHTLDTPYTAVEWPQISQEDQDAILELLCQLLSPIGNHRRSFLVPSKGKRKRSKPADASNTGASAVPDPSSPPAPELSAYVDVGLSQISRTLQAMSSTTHPTTTTTSSSSSSSSSAASSEAAAAAAAAASGPNPNPTPESLPYTIIFIARSNPSPAFHSHFPQLVALASRPRPPSAAVRLVGFSKACEGRLSEALGIPRASCIALREGAPQAKGLVEFVRDKVKPIEAGWVDEVKKAAFLETKIKAVPTKVGAKKVKVG